MRTTVKHIDDDLKGYLIHRAEPAPFTASKLETVKKTFESALATYDFDARIELYKDAITIGLVKKCKILNRCFQTHSMLYDSDESFIVGLCDTLQSYYDNYVYKGVK